MELVDILTILAIVVGPIAAVLVSVHVGNAISDRRTRRDQKFLILSTIVAWAWKPVSAEPVKALNAIDLFFHDVPTVRQKWMAYYDSLCRRDLKGQELWDLWRKKRLELIHSIADDLGFGGTMSQLDFDRIYTPEGLVGDFHDWDLGTVRDAIKLLREREAKLEAAAKAPGEV